MVSRKPREQNRRLVHEVGVEVVLSEPGGWCVERRVGEVVVGHAHHRVQVQAPVTAAAMAT
jgi:hypothetical protein